MEMRKICRVTGLAVNGQAVEALNRVSQHRPAEKYGGKCQG